MGKMVWGLSVMVWAAFLPMTSHAQRPDGIAGPAFEVVSVKHSGSNEIVHHGPGPMAFRATAFQYLGDRVTCDLPLRAIINEAFSITEDHGLENAEWLNTETYQLAALVPCGADKDMAHLMLQRMLRERFGLQYHHEQREKAGYALIEAKKGFKLQPVDPEKAKERVIETPMGPICDAVAMGPGLYVAPSVSLEKFATYSCLHKWMLRWWT